MPRPESKVFKAPNRGTGNPFYIQWPRDWNATMFAAVVEAILEQHKVLVSDESAPKAKK